MRENAAQPPVIKATLPSSSMIDVSSQVRKFKERITRDIIRFMRGFIPPKPAAVDIERVFDDVFVDANLGKAYADIADLLASMVDVKTMKAFIERKSRERLPQYDTSRGDEYAMLFDQVYAYITSNEAPNEPKVVNPPSSYPRLSRADVKGASVYKLIEVRDFLKGNEGTSVLRQNYIDAVNYMFAIRTDELDDQLEGLVQTPIETLIDMRSFALSYYSRADPSQKRVLDEFESVYEYVIEEKHHRDASVDPWAAIWTNDE
jgi:hypothetical protein